MVVELYKKKKRVDGCCCMFLAIAVLWLAIRGGVVGFASMIWLGLGREWSGLDCWVELSGNFGWRYCLLVSFPAKA